jgi:hypothetical protein
MIQVTNITSGQNLTLPIHAFSGRFFPAHGGIWSSVLRAKRIRCGDFVLSQLNAQGVAAFECAGGQSWIAFVR